MATEGLSVSLVLRDGREPGEPSVVDRLRVPSNMVLIRFVGVCEHFAADMLGGQAHTAILTVERLRRLGGEWHQAKVEFVGARDRVVHQADLKTSKPDLVVDKLAEELLQGIPRWDVGEGQRYEDRIRYLNNPRG